MTQTKKVIVIGAGPGGLATAMLLSARGYHVTVFEKQPYLGGRTSAVRMGDFTFDRGPTFLMMPELLEALFEGAGRRLHDYVSLKEVDPLYTLRFGDLDFSPSRDGSKTEAQIEQHFPGNVNGYRQFMEKEGKKFDRVIPLLQQPFSKLTDYMNANVFRALPRIDALQTVYGRLSTYFKDERLRWAFAFQAKYLGMSPWDCPATFTILSYLEHRFGLFHPIGGVNQICEAMAKVTTEYGGKVVTSSPVKQILVKNQEAYGVELASGDVVLADDVVINADFAYAMTALFPDKTLKKYDTRKLEKKSYSCSTFMLYLGVNKPIDLPHHTILFAKDYQKNVDELTRLGILSEDPSIYVHNPSTLDPTLAPEGQSALYVLMPVPNLDAQVEWENVQEQVVEQILDRLEQEPELKGLRESIVVQKCLSPKDWETDHHVYKGATFNLSHKLGQMMIRRPHNQFEEVGHCFLVGGGTHPGSGLPTILESAKISADLLDRQYTPSSQSKARVRKERSLSWTSQSSEQGLGD